MFPIIGNPTYMPIPSQQLSINNQPTILVVEDDMLILKMITSYLEQESYQVLQARDGLEAMELIVESPPDLILSDILMPNLNGLELLQRLRSHPDTNQIPILLLTAKVEPDDVIEGLKLGADDYLTKPVDLRILQARIDAKLSRSLYTKPATNNTLPITQTLYDWDIFTRELERELTRSKQHPSKSYLACIKLLQMERLVSQLGNIKQHITKQVHAQVLFDKVPLEIFVIDDEGLFFLLLPEISLDDAQERLLKLSNSIAQTDFLIKNQRVRFTPVIGYVELNDCETIDETFQLIDYALEDAHSQLDLVPKIYNSTKISRFSTWLRWIEQFGNAIKSRIHIDYFRKHVRTAVQVSMTLSVGIGFPFFLYIALGIFGIDITQIVYIGVVVALLLTAILIWFEGLLALRNNHIAQPVKTYPLASAIIAAYLPNEAETIIPTLEAFLHVNYPIPIQIILAYNTPHDMPIEDTLKAMAIRNPNFKPLRVENSTSKAQNVNAALEYVTGEFVGVFDADHQPYPDNFKKAWQWLAHDYDVVQGHCVIRNGSTSWLARLIAVEFEAIYAVAHPGRARMHGFGIFGGSNGYWKTDLLRNIRMHGFMLTEDIDSSMRVTTEGYKIKVAPDIVSTELAPTSFEPLWNQRMRWAQGWFQVSLKHVKNMLLSPHITLQQKVGIWHLVVWREFYPWISMQIIPIVLYWIVRNGGLDNIDWFIPIFVVTSIVTLGTGPAQIFYIYRLSHQSIKQHKRWFVFYMLASFFYTEYKNTIARVAQVKEFMQEKKWVTTPRN